MWICVQSSYSLIIKLFGISLVLSLGLDVNRQVLPEDEDGWIQPWTGGKGQPSGGGGEDVWELRPRLQCKLRILKSVVA